MLVSTKGRYALRVMIDLAENSYYRSGGDTRISLADIAERQSISEKYLESILPSLVRGGLLSGTRGKGGGYQLTHSPEEYTVGSILKLVEETIAPVQCLVGDTNTCALASKCRTLPLWQGLDAVVDNYLESYTLANLCNPEPKKGSRMLMPSGKTK